MTSSSRISSTDDKRMNVTRLSEVTQDGFGGLCAHGFRQLFPAGAAHAGHRTKRREQRLPTPGTDARDLVERRPEIAGFPGRPVEGQREPVRLVSNALNQPERGVLARQRDALGAVPGEQQLFLL